ncbi:hypothetical protein BJV78DRAFT_1320368 [Lactifluus subvellereus]|nr:hypothetical protein BJV78DRAFT_1320368 [Lactifluus subvellereus]
MDALAYLSAPDLHSRDNCGHDHEASSGGSELRRPLKWQAQSPAEASSSLSQKVYPHPSTSMPNSSKDDLWDLAFSNVGQQGSRRRPRSDVAQAIQTISGIPQTNLGSNKTGETAVSSSPMPTSGKQGTTVNSSAPKYSDNPASQGIPGHHASTGPSSNQPWRAHSQFRSFMGSEGAAESSAVPTSNQGTMANLSTSQYPSYPASSIIPGRRPHPVPGSNQTWKLNEHT